MTNKYKNLLLIEFCTRLPYGFKIKTPRGIYTVDAVSSEGLFSIPNDNNTLDDLTPHDGHYWLPITDDYKPYLRPMSSMTESEEFTYEYKKKNHTEWEAQDYLNSIHIDYRGLIPMGLALPAPEGMY